MKKVLLLITIIIVLGLNGCKQNIDTEFEFENGNLDLNEFEVEVFDTRYEISGTIYFTPDQDLDELYLMMFSNANDNNEELITITELKVNDKEVEYEFDGLDNSALHLTLGDQLNSGELVVVDYIMDCPYPNRFRLTHEDEVLYSMFFYPYIAMMDEEGWDTDPYTYRGETYYNKISNYDVTINIDQDYVVAAPGILMGSMLEDGKIQYRYVLEEARDFSFSASPNYRIYTRNEDGIDFEIYSLRELSDKELQHSFEYTIKSFDVFERYVGDYYYDRFILELGNVFGMESSGIIYCSQDISEGTIVHEIVHQWFFFMIGNDQYNDSFLDESLTTYMSMLYYYDMYGMGGYNSYLDYRSSNQIRFADYWSEYGGDSLLQNVNEIGDGYAFVIYYHGPSIFRQYVSEYLDNDVEEFARIISVYYDLYHGKIVTVEQFLTLIENESGVNGTKEWFYKHLNELQSFDN